MVAISGSQPDAEDIARAWELYHVECVGGVRQVASRMGISIGTAHSYLATAREHLEWVHALDRAEHRDGMIGRLLTYLSWLMEQKTTGRDPLEVIKVALQVEDRLRAVMGLDAPARLSVTDDREQPGVRPDVIAAVRQVEQAAERRRRELEQGN
jgi:hypothetical protein